MLLLGSSTIARGQSVATQDADGARNVLAAGVAIASIASAASLGGSIAELTRTSSPRGALSDLDGSVHRITGGVLLGIGTGMLAAAIALGVRYERSSGRRPIAFVLQR